MCSGAPSPYKGNVELTRCSLYFSFIYCLFCTRGDLLLRSFRPTSINSFWEQSHAAGRSFNISFCPLSNTLQRNFGIFSILIPFKLVCTAQIWSSIHMKRYLVRKWKQRKGLQVLQCSLKRPSLGRCSWIWPSLVRCSLVSSSLERCSLFFF